MSDPAMTARGPSSQPGRPESADYRLFIEREWADLHHSRVQEWSSLGVVTGAHVAIVGFLNYASDADLLVSMGTLGAASAIVGLFFAIVGGLMTCRHRALMQTKLNWISAAERKLGLVKDKDNPAGVLPADAQPKPVSNPRRLTLPRLFSTSGLILMFYTLFAICDLVGVVCVLEARRVCAILS